MPTAHAVWQICTCCLLFSVTSALKMHNNIPTLNTALMLLMQVSNRAKKHLSSNDKCCLHMQDWLHHYLLGKCQLVLTSIANYGYTTHSHVMPWTQCQSKPK